MLSFKAFPAICLCRFFMCEVFFLGTARRIDSQISDSRDGSTAATAYRDAWYFAAREPVIELLAVVYIPSVRVKAVGERSPAEGPASRRAAILRGSCEYRSSLYQTSASASTSPSTCIPTSTSQHHHRRKKESRKARQPLIGLSHRASPQPA